MVLRCLPRMSWRLRGCDSAGFGSIFASFPSRSKSLSQVRIDGHGCVQPGFVDPVVTGREFAQADMVTSSTRAWTG
jgi:hypothetical protein